MKRWSLALLVLIALAGFAMRYRGVAGERALGSVGGYDDGVYFSASALLVRGVLPYRDFTFVHPPAILYVLATTSWMNDPAAGFAMSRVVAAVIGGMNIALIGLLIARVSHPIGGIVAALLYAGYPDAISAERSPYIEPALNFACLLAAWFWLRGRSVAGGVATGLACALKFWAGIWVLAALATSRNLRRDVLPFLGGAIVAGLLALAPLALTAPNAFLAQTLRFQLERPPDGTIDKSARLLEIADSGHRAATALAIVALVVIVVKLFRRSTTIAERYFAVVAVLTVAAFLASSSYWSHYNSYLATSQCALAGLGAAALVQSSPRFRGAIAAAVIALILIIDGGLWRQLWREAKAQSGELVGARHVVTTHVPRGARFFAFDPTWSLVAGRLPDCCDGAPAVVDSYGAMLMSSIAQRGRATSTDAAFHGGVSHPEIRARLAASQFVLLGWRGQWQLDKADRAWFAERFRCVNPEAGDLCVWTKRDRLAAANPFLEDQHIRFEDGWWGGEGVPPQTWRWMAARSTAKLPAIDGKARLELELDVPLDILKPPTITIAFDGKELERFTADDLTITRAYDVDALGGSPHQLTITSDRTFNPARDGMSGDTRDLSVKLTRIVWRPSAAAATSSRK